MKYKRVLHYFRPGDLAGLERELDRRSGQGWQPDRPGRWIQRYRSAPGARIHRIGYCAAAGGSAEEIAYLAAQKRAGWEPGPRRKGWILFSKDAASAEPGEELSQGRDPIRTLFQARIARLESFRRWMLVISAVLLIVGYAADCRPLFYGCLVPLSAALFVSYRIKFMEEGPEK